MIGLEDRQALAQDIDQAHTHGARLEIACEVAGISLRTLQRWQAEEGRIREDGRPCVLRPIPSHILSEEECAKLLAVANEPRFADVPPARIVPMLADEGSIRQANRPLAACSRRMGNSSIVVGPKRRGQVAHPPRTLPRHRARSGAGI